MTNRMGSFSISSQSLENIDVRRANSFPSRLTPPREGRRKDPRSPSPPRGVSFRPLPKELDTKIQSALSSEDCYGLNMVLEKEECPKLVYVPPWKIFNLPLFSNFLVVDLRPKSEFVRGHISSSVSIPPPPNPKETANKDRVTEMLRVLQQYLDEFGAPDHLEVISMVGPKEHMQWFHRALTMLVQMGPKALIPASTSNKSSTASASLPKLNISQRSIFQFAERIQKTCKQLWAIIGGFKAFSQQFPPLCDTRAGGVGHLRPTPCFVSKNIYLGSRIVNLDDPFLRDIGVQCAIVSRNFCVPRGDLKLKNVTSSKGEPGWGNQFRNGYLTYLPVSAPDEPNRERWCRTWTASVNFIHQSLQSGKGIIIQVHGRSMSASIACAWMIASEGLNPRDAVAKIASVSRKIDKKLVFEDDLIHWANSVLPYSKPKMLTTGSAF